MQIIKIKKKNTSLAWLDGMTESSSSFHRRCIICSSFLKALGSTERMLDMPRALVKEKRQQQKKTLSQVQLALKCKLEMMPFHTPTVAKPPSCIFPGTPVCTTSFFWAQTSTLAFANRPNSPRPDEMRSYTKKNLGKTCGKLSGANASSYTAVHT